MIGMAEGFGMCPRRPLKPVVKRSLTHYEKNHPYRHRLYVPSVAAGRERRSREKGRETSKAAYKLIKQVFAR